jgi:hypothetical protein
VIVAIGCAILAATPCTSLGQEELAVRVKVEVSPGVPIPSALVSLVDGSNRVIREGLSSGSGRIVMSAPRGSYTVRVRRIGFKPFVSQEFALPQSDELVIQVETERIVLAATRVGASARCGKINPDADALAEIWEEVEKSLRSSQLTASDLAPISGLRVYQRRVIDTTALYSLDTTMLRLPGLKAFGTPDPGAVASLGYVRGNASTGWEFYGPDEEVLLSDEFAATHCFRIVRDSKRANQVGVAFKPVAGRRVADIEGIMWLDEESAVLREVVFSFVNTGALTRWESGGFTRFARVASGAIIVDEWQLRMPSVAYLRRRLDLVAYIERGGISLR